MPTAARMLTRREPDRFHRPWVARHLLVLLALLCAPLGATSAAASFTVAPASFSSGATIKVSLEGPTVSTSYKLRLEQASPGTFKFDLQSFQSGFATRLVLKPKVPNVPAGHYQKVQANDGTALRAVIRSSTLSGMSFTEITSMVIANANDASTNASVRVTCWPRSRNPSGRRIGATGLPSVTGCASKTVGSLRRYRRCTEWIRPGDRGGPPDVGEPVAFRRRADCAGRSHCAGVASDR